MDVEHPPAMELSGGDRRREAPLDEFLDEVGALLAVDDAGEAAVLALEEDAGVQQHVHQESRLALGKAKGGDGFQRWAFASSMVQRSGGGASVIGSTPPRFADAPCVDHRHRARRPCRRSRRSR